MTVESTPVAETSSGWIQFFQKKITWEVLLFAGIILLVILSRYYELGARVMSHDETQHTYFSWLFFQGNGYKHTPLTHGPLQFHLIALSYAIFGDSDLASRIPHAFASVLAIVFLWNYRRYLGKTGTLVAAVLMLISPFMLYYGRYARNESLVVLFGLITIWAILRYIETGKSRYLLYLTAATALHFTAKETAFIYTAQAILFLTILLINRITHRPWKRKQLYNPFIIMTILGFVLLGIAFIEGVYNASLEQGITSQIPNILILMPETLSLVCFLSAAIIVILGVGMQEIRRERSFNLAMLLGLLVLPQLAPFPVRYLGYNPLAYTSSPDMIATATTLVVLFVITFGLGIWWNWRLFLANMAVFYSIFTLFYTTLFTYSTGFVTGLVGSLGYWLEQQGVERGSQPWYYYLLIQIPVYEFLPLLASILTAGIIIIRKIFRKAQPESSVAEPPEVEQSELISQPVAETKPHTFDPIDKMNSIQDIDQPKTMHSFNPFTYPQEAPVLSLLGFWAITSMAAYSIAGEKMPWLAVHITLPLILLAGWGLGQLIERINWKQFLQQNGLLILILLPLFVISLQASFELAANIFSGIPIIPPEIPGLVAYAAFAVITGGILLFLLRHWSPAQFARIALLAGFIALAFLTARAAWQAAFIRYDEATEFLVYAHSAPSNKLLVNEIGELSQRIYGDASIGIAYDNTDGEGDPASAWPLTWYLRNFKNTRTFGPETPRELLEYPIIFASDRNWDKVKPILREAYDEFQYIRMWWPTQDYFNLTWERIWNALRNPEMRSALYDIWLNRDYTHYAQLTNQNMTLPNWQPSRSMKMFVRKDVSSQVWNQGTSPVTIELPSDPYAGSQTTLEAQVIFGSQGSEPGQFQDPRGIAQAADGSIYVADTGNHRIQHLSQNGDVLHVWGSFSGSEASLDGTAAPGTFNEPWDVAVAPDGMVYVADTWNSRIQKFTPDGEFVTMWGDFGQGETLDAFWGPRGIAVDSTGRVFVSDTGNKRIAIFGENGEPLSAFEGGLNEPVGIDISQDGKLFIADTWNQRIVVASEAAENIFTSQTSWPIDGWFSQSLENKPYLATSPDGNLFVTDPEGYRVLQFSQNGEFIQTWGIFGSDALSFMLPVGISAGQDGSVWVSDTGSNQVMKFQISASGE